MTQERNKQQAEARARRAERWAAAREVKTQKTIAEREAQEAELREKELQWRLTKELERERQMKERLQAQVGGRGAREEQDEYI